MAAVNWTSMNALAGGAWRGSGMRVRYEDLVKAPAEVTERILRAAGIDATVPFGADGSVETGVQHTVAGNPMRMGKEPLVVRGDDAWRREMSGAAKAAVTAISWPLLMRYGYPLRPGRGPAP